MATKKVKVLRVVSRKDKFRRAGFEFGTDAKNLPLDTLSAEQLAAIQGDANLVVVEAEVVIDEDGNVVETPQAAQVPQAVLTDAEARLREWATELNAQANALTDREDQVKAREEAVAAAEAALAEREAVLAAKEAALAQAAGQAVAKAAGKGGK